MPDMEEIEPRALRHPAITFGAFALFIDAVLCVSAWTALERQILLVPPFFVFLTLDHPLFPALLTLIICGIEYAIDHRAPRGLFLAIAIILVFLAAAHIRSEAGREQQSVDGWSHE
jgi:hypothetical protein